MSRCLKDFHNTYRYLPITHWKNVNASMMRVQSPILQQTFLFVFRSRAEYLLCEKCEWQSLERKIKYLLGSRIEKELSKSTENRSLANSPLIFRRHKFFLHKLKYILYFLPPASFKVPTICFFV